MPAAELLMIALRDRFGDYAVARDTLLSVGLSQRQARRLWQGQGPIAPEVLTRLDSLLPEAAAALVGLGEPSVLDALRAIEPVHAREFWVTDRGVDLAETGLDAWAAWHLGHEPDGYRTDLVQLLLRTHGYIAVVQTGDGPVLIDWSESSVDPAALRHLRRALVAWGAPPEGYRFGSDVARRPILTLRDAIRHIDQALARQGGGGTGDVQIEAEPLPLAAATPRLQAALDLWRDVGSSPRGLAAYPRDVLAHAVVYHVTEQGLVTAAVGEALPLIFEDRRSIVGRRTETEPTPAAYRSMILAHVAEAISARQPRLHHIHVCNGRLDVSYHRVTVPVARNRKVVAAITVTDSIRGLDVGAPV